MDDLDRAFIDSIVPDEAAMVEFVTVALWVNEAGEQRWRVYSQMDAPLTTTLGLLELAKLELIARCDTGLPLRYDDSDD